MPLHTTLSEPPVPVAVCVESHDQFPASVTDDERSNDPAVSRFGCVSAMFATGITPRMACEIVPKMFSAGTLDVFVSSLLAHAPSVPRSAANGLLVSAETSGFVTLVSIHFPISLSGNDVRLSNAEGILISSSWSLAKKF